MSSTAISFRRFLHSISCVRTAASTARSSPRASDPPPPSDPDELELSSGTLRKDQLLNLMTNLADQPHNYEAAQGRKSSTPVADFQENRLIRPVDFNRIMHRPRPLGWRRASIGPGREARYGDIFLQLGIDPRREADNVTLMSNFMTNLGRIQPRNRTTLSQRSQRLLGKAIKRAKMMGVIPTFSNPKLKDRPQNLSTNNRRLPNSDRKDRFNFSGR